MDLSLVVIVVVFGILFLYFITSYKPLRVDVNEYMISVPNRKIHYKWNEIKKIHIQTPAPVLSPSPTPITFSFNKGFEINIKYIVTPKKGKTLVFSLSQIRSPHPTLKIHSIPKLIEKKKKEYGI